MFNRTDHGVAGTALTLRFEKVAHFE